MSYGKDDRQKWSLTQFSHGPPDPLQANGTASVTRTGDCLAPGRLASAVYGGHRSAREFDQPDDGDVPFLRERVKV